MAQRTRPGALVQDIYFKEKGRAAAYPARFFCWRILFLAAGWFNFSSTSQSRNSQTSILLRRCHGGPACWTLHSGTDHFGVAHLFIAAGWTDAFGLSFGFRLCLNIAAATITIHTMTFRGHNPYLSCFYEKIRILSLRSSYLQFHFFSMSLTEICWNERPEV